MSRADREILAARDALYGIFLRSLERKSFARDLKTFDPEKYSGRARDYALEKLPRYAKAAAAWSELGSDPVLGALKRARVLLENGLYFDAHEYLESFWKNAEGERKRSLQGVIQIAAGLHKLELDRQAWKGAQELVAKGWEKMKTPEEPFLRESLGTIALVVRPAIEKSGLRLVS